MSGFIDMIALHDKKNKLSKQFDKIDDNENEIGERLDVPDSFNCEDKNYVIHGDRLFIVKYSDCYNSWYIDEEVECSVAAHINIFPPEEDE